MLHIHVIIMILIFIDIVIILYDYLVLFLDILVVDLTYLPNFIINNIFISQSFIDGLSLLSINSQIICQIYHKIHLFYSFLIICIVLIVCYVFLF
jgi:hypothetical protein